MSDQNAFFCRVLFGLLALVPLARAEEPLRVVTEAYPPFVYQEDGKAKGIDWEVTQAILEEMGIGADLQFCRWKRCLVTVQSGYADAILDVNKTPDREKHLVFPEEHLSRAPTVFFQREGQEFHYTSPDELPPVKAGTILGYHYCDELAKAPLKIEEGKSLEQNFEKLLQGRLTLVIENVFVGRFIARETGIADQVEVVPGARFCEQEKNYLAFAKYSRYAALAERFSQALSKFKGTDRYRQILAKYGMESSALPGSVGPLQ